MDSVSSTIENSLGNARRGGWAAMASYRTQRRAEAYPIIRTMCREMGTDLNWLSSRTEIVSRRLTGGEPGARTCPICSKGTVGEDCWTFVLENRPGKFCGKKMAVHTKCVDSKVLAEAV